MIEFTILDPRVRRIHLGYLPMIFNANDTRPAREQVNDRYAHGGGWSPQSKWVMAPDRKIKYPGDPILKPIAEAKLNDETIVVYPYSQVAIIQPDGSYEIARMD